MQLNGGKKENCNRKSGAWDQKKRGKMEGGSTDSEWSRILFA